MKITVHKLLVLCTFITYIECVPELQLLHVVFAHKTYAPILDLINSTDISLPSKLIYEHFNSASFNMPNTGKLNMYNLGVHLRNIYEQFLGNIYTQNTMKMQTTKYPLSMISGQLVNAGLWPPSEIEKWNSDLDWQPIPTDYVSKQEDTLLLGMHCPSSISEMRKVLNTDQVQKTLLYYLPLFELVSNYTGMEIRQPSEIALLYSVLETQINYYMGVDGETIPLKIVDCTEICPLETFMNLYLDVIPQNEELLCNRWNTDIYDKNITMGGDKYNRSDRCVQKNIIIALLFVMTLCVY